MKYQQGKIKTQHHYLKEFKPLFKQLEKMKEITRIIPGRISRKQQGTGKKHVTFSYTTHSGLKLQFKKGGTAQEIFIICNKSKTPLLIKKLQAQNIIT